MMNKIMRRHAAKLLSGIMTAAMCVSVVPQITGNNTVSAATAKNTSDTYLGTSVIAAPSAPSGKDSAWSGSYVYFGAYDQFTQDSVPPILFRVLDPSATEFGGKTLFLDSDLCIAQDYFDKKSASWSDSSVKEWLNGEFLNDAFTEQEKAAISGSTKSSAVYAEGSYNEYSYVTSVALTGEKVFLLDAGDVMNPKYGYSDDPGWINTDDDWSTNSDVSGTEPFYTVFNRTKVCSTGDKVWWWLRSKYNPQTGYAGMVIRDGYMGGVESKNIGTCIAPALNVDLGSVVFSTVVSGTAGQSGAKYKLTIADSNIVIGSPSSSIDGSKVTVSYQLSGNNKGNVTRASVLILDKKFK